MTKLIAGVDEAGRGPLAGPVVAAAVVFKEDYKNPALKDSKTLSKLSREMLYPEIINSALAYSIIAVGHHRIHKLNIREATKLAMSLAVKRIKADLVLIDGNMLINTNLPQECIIKGDSKIVQISAASILAKVYRDRLMKLLDQKYPGFGFSIHSGYGTKRHMEAISQIGISSVHRKGFRGVKEHLSTY